MKISFDALLVYSFGMLYLAGFVMIILVTIGVMHPLG